MEVRVDGYEKIREPQIRQTLKESGLYEGCRKNIDLDKIKVTLFDEYDEISWVGIGFTGNLAQVSIAEGARPVKPGLEKKTPCSIVADKAGYISRIIPREGVRAADEGAYVKKGQVLINGAVPLQNVAYGTDSEKETTAYVHAAGTAEAKVPIRLNYFAQRYERIKTGTGKKVWSIAVNDHDFAGGFRPYEVCQAERKRLLNIVKPFRLKIDLISREQVILTQREVKDRELKKTINMEIRQYAKEKLPKNAQILNKSLNFSREKNIITVGVTLETLQQIGIEEEIIVDKSEGKSKKGNHKRGN